MKARDPERIQRPAPSCLEGHPRDPSGTLGLSWKSSAGDRGLNVSRGLTWHSLKPCLHPNRFFDPVSDFLLGISNVPAPLWSLQNPQTQALPYGSPILGLGFSLLSHVQRRPEPWWPVPGMVSPL